MKSINEQYNIELQENSPFFDGLNYKIKIS